MKLVLLSKVSELQRVSNTGKAPGTKKAGAKIPRADDDPQGNQNAPKMPMRIVGVGDEQI